MATASVTGATRGAGHAVAIAVAKMGWSVRALGRDCHMLERMRTDLGITRCEMNLTDRDEARALAESIRPQALAHEAPRWPDAEDVVPASEADIEKVTEVNLSAALHLTDAFRAGMCAERRGAIPFFRPALANAPSAILGPQLEQLRPSRAD